LSIYLAIDETDNLIYEGQYRYGRVLWPTPIISPSTFVSGGANNTQYPKRRDLFSYKFIFREDGYDPVSRTRRGRFYKINDQPKIEWFVIPYNALSNGVAATSADQQKKVLYTFGPVNISNIIERPNLNKTMVYLGTEDQFSIWSIINLESIATGEDLVTLRMRPTIGILPDLILSSIPEKRRDKIQQLLDKFANDVFKAAPESVIDRARDSASAILGAYNEREGFNRFEKDLGQQINPFKRSEKKIALNCAEIIRRLHPRAKPNEQEKYRLRTINEQDAELAVNCIGTILCELGWARWM